MLPLVSVVVPVYKTEDVLLRCFDSLQRQSLTNIEIILVDDGSPDCSGQVCDTYAARDMRFKVYHQSYQGVAETRNFGIQMATGGYLMFVDSDDWVDDHFCEEAYQCAVKYKADVVMFGLQRERKSLFFGNRSFRAHTIREGYKNHEEAVELVVSGAVGRGPCNKLYKRELFEGIIFPKGSFYEDVGTIYKVVSKAKSVYCIDKILYYHCYRPGSITTLRTEKALHDWIEMYLQLYRDLSSWGYPPEKLETLLESIALGYCIKKKPCTSDEHYDFCAGVLHECKSIPSHFNWKRKVLFVLFKYCNPLFELICLMFGRKYC